MAAPSSLISINGPANLLGNFTSNYTPAQAGAGTLISRLPIVAVSLSGGAAIDGWSFNCQDGGTLERLVDESGDTFVRGNYPALDSNGGMYIFGGFDFFNYGGVAQDMYVQFYARQPFAKNGLKFCKMFGSNEGIGYANATFGFATEADGVSGGYMSYLAYGDGSGEQNDTSHGISIDPEAYISPGRAGQLTTIIERGPAFNSSDWGAGWHKFQFRLKQNSGTTLENEINDGVVEGHIDGILRARGTNIFNRNHLNAFIAKIGLFDYSRDSIGGFSLDYKKVTVSSNGYVD